VNGRYYWAPFQQIREMKVSPPEDLRDLVWLPSQFTWVNGGEAVGLIPTRYPGSENAQDSAVQLARTTQWQELADGVYQGLGVRMFTTDQDDYPLLDVREVKING
jgi:type VI secretion system protein ImpE